MTEEIKTNMFMKQKFKYDVARFLGSSTPNCYDYLGQFVNLMLSKPKVRDILKDKLGDNYDKYMKAANLHSVNYIKIGLIQKSLVDAETPQMVRDVLDDELNKVIKYTPLINARMLDIFYHILIHTDLSRVPIPSELVMNPDSHSGKFNMGSSKPGEKNTPGNPFER